MTAVRIIRGDTLQAELRRDLAPVLRAISANLGPDGRAALYALGPRVRQAVTGADIARHFCGSGPSAVLLREALVSMDRDLGDGTSRMAVMTGAALKTGRKALAAGIHPSQLSRAVEGLRSEISLHFDAVTSQADNIAGVLAAALPGEMQAELIQALELAGLDGHVELSDQSELGLRVDHVEGFSANMEPLLSSVLTHMDHVNILVVNDIITDFRSLAPVIESFAHSKKSLLIAARGLEGTAKQLLERNREAQVLRVAAVTPRDQGLRAAEILRDLAVATGATIVDEETGQTLDTLTPSHLGTAATFRRNGDHVTFLFPTGDREKITARLRDIEHEIQRNRYLALDREHAQSRYARLSGRWVEMFVGVDHFKPNLRILMTRALASVRSARSAGTIKGAGVGLAEVAELLEAATSADPADRVARLIVAETLRATGSSLRHNAGLEALDGALPSKELFDPAQLSRDLLDLALSLALQILTLETAVLRTPDHSY
jgi:chaperonin GroEL